MKRTTRYQAAIVLDDQLLLLWVMDALSGRQFWVIPGGGIEPGETEEACVIREAWEETCLYVEVERLLFDDIVVNDETYERSKTYLCRVTGGEPKAGREPGADTDTFATIQQVAWFDLHAPQTWPSVMCDDAITYPLVQQIRETLGYEHPATESPGTPRR